MLVEKAILDGIEILNKNNIEEAKLIAKVYLANVLGIKKEDLIRYIKQELNEDLQKKFFDGIEKMASGYPLQYLTHSKEFMKMDFFVNEDVLIPRADTENLVEEVIKLAKGKKDILELCTGSGVIAISLAKYKEGLNITATDISRVALAISKLNAKNLLNDKTINFIESDMFANVEGKFDIIVSNPPYIKHDVIKEYNLEYEPLLALDRRGRWT